MGKDSGWEKILKKRKREEADKVGTLFDVGVKKQKTTTASAPENASLSTPESAPAQSTAG